MKYLINKNNNSWGYQPHTIFNNSTGCPLVVRSEINSERSYRSHPAALQHWNHYSTKSKKYFFKMLTSIFSYRLSLQCIIAFFALLFSANAQTKSAPQILANIYKNYDTLKYITFDVKFNYTIDTANGEPFKDQLNGTYTMAGKKAKYILGDIETMQNDSFFIAAYHKDKFIIVSNPITNNSGYILPLRDAMDSLLKNYATQYKITTSVTDEMGNIVFTRSNPQAAFNKFVITYNSEQNLLQKITYDFDEPAFFDEEQQQNLPAKKNTLTVEFSNYRFENYSQEIYDENKYIFFENGRCKPVSKFKDYQIYYSK